MGIQFAVHTYGHSDAMFLVLNGIKMIMATSFFSSLIQLVAFLSVSYYAILGMAGATDGRLQQYFLKTFAVVLVVGALLTPKADMLVIDRVSGKKEIVSGLPYAFVIPVGTLEAIGAGITSSFEQAFSKVASTPFKDYGLVFGHRMVQESRNFKIANPEFARNMNTFLSRCVVLEASIGTRFTTADVKYSKDLFGLVSKNAGTFRKVDFKVNGNYENLTCKAAAKQLEIYFKTEMGFLSEKLKNTDFSIAGTKLLNLGGNRLLPRDKLNKSLAKNLEIGYKTSLGVTAKAEDIVRQNMMINALKNYNNASDLYGYSRASQLQNSNWAIASSLAETTLPLFLNIFKALVYASFIFIVPLMLMKGGMQKYFGYCTVVFSLQIWPALNSILNLFIELGTNAKSSGQMLSYGTFNGSHDAVSSIAFVAMGLQGLIPFLSFSIAKGGVGGFMHLASSMQSATAGAASIVSGEMTSGSRSFDNISKGSTSVDNKSGFKTDFNQSTQDRAITNQAPNGDIIKTQGDGSTSITSGKGINHSGGAKDFFIGKATSTALSQNLSRATSALKGDEKSFVDAKSSTMNKMSSLVSEIAKAEAGGETINWDQMGEKGKSLQEAVNYTKDYASANNNDFTQGSKAAMNTYVDAGGKIPDFVPLIAGSAGVRTDAEISAGNSSSQSLSDSENLSTRAETGENLGNSTRVSTLENWMEDNKINSSYGEDIRSGYDKMKTYQGSINTRKEEVQNYSSALEQSKNSTAENKADMYHKVEKGVMTQFGVSQSEAHNMIENDDPRVGKVWNGIVSSRMNSMLTDVKNSKPYNNRVESSFTRTPSHTTVQALSHTAVLSLYFANSF
jgi:conjugal transfer mating pair stabilization protein TraG